MDGQWEEPVLRRELSPLLRRHLAVLLKRWLPQLAISLVIYFLSVQIIGRLVNALAFLLVKDHSLVLWEVIHEHPFARANFVGLLAGLVPLRIWLVISGFLNSTYEDYLRDLNTEAVKPWIWALFSPLIFVELLEWTTLWFQAARRNSSVLQTNPQFHLSEFVKGFLSTDCSSFGPWPMEPWETKFSFQCVIHVQMLSVWLLGVGYSLAPLVSRKFVAAWIKHREEFGNAESVDNEEIAMEEKAEKQ